MKKMLITGINGFIGNAAKKYFEKNYVIYGIDAAGETGDRTYILDMRSEEFPDVLSEIDPDIVVHAAGGADVSKSLKNPIEDFDSSVQIFYALLESMRRINRESKTIFLSSAAVYGNAKVLPISETAETRPISPYGLHKKMCEEIAEYYRHIYDMDIRILRIFSVYGPGLRKQIMWDMFQKYKKDKKIELFGTGDEARDFIYIDDLMQSIEIILNADISSRQPVFNVANGESNTIYEIAHIFSKYLCGENKVVFNHMTRSGDPDVWRADIGRIKELGYHNKVSMKEGIENYIEWARREG
ncbi:MAG: NAD-dependent epimerase/dehydratase family protein [Roseburia sp.]|nr:NAD-dependent epimerase/dehydratase family protein [Roseburia sp.]